MAMLMEERKSCGSVAELEMSVDQGLVDPTVRLLKYRLQTSLDYYNCRPWSIHLGLL